MIYCKNTLIEIRKTKKYVIYFIECLLIKIINFLILFSYYLLTKK